jgi:hypothetical protein
MFIIAIQMDGRIPVYIEHRRAAGQGDSGIRTMLFMVRRAAGVSAASWRWLDRADIAGAGFVSDQ